MSAMPRRCSKLPVEVLKVVGPQALYVNAEQTLAPRLRFLRERAGIPAALLPTAVARAPSMLFLSVDGNLAPTLAFFTDELCGAPLNPFKRFLENAPAAGRLRPTTDPPPPPLHPEAGSEARLPCPAWSRTRCAGPLRARLRRARLGADPPAVPKERLALALAKSPSLLCRSVDAHLRPVAAFLETEAGLSREAVAAIFGRQPQIFMSSLDKKLRPNLALLRGHLGLDAQQARHRPGAPAPLRATHGGGSAGCGAGCDARAPRRQAAKLLSAQPSLLGASLDAASASSLRTKADFLAAALALSPTEVGAMAAGMPALLAMSVESTLRPKIEFLLGDFAALPSDVAGFPQARPRAPSAYHLCSLASGFASRRRARIAPSRCRQRVLSTSVAGWSERA